MRAERMEKVMRWSGVYPVKAVAVVAAVIAVILAATLAGSVAGAQVPQCVSAMDTDTKLQDAVKQVAAAHRGRVALFAERLGSPGAAGEEIQIDADTPVQTASVIKLGILYEAMVAVREGRAHWDEKIELKPGDAVPGSGVLTFLDAPLTLTLKDVLTLMVILSDNTATNLAIDRFGIAKVNARMESLGLQQTHLYKKVFKPAEGPMPADQPKFGLGKTTPREMATLMTDIGECKLRRQVYPLPPGASASVLPFLPMDDADKAVCGVALKMLKGQFSRETIPRFLPNGGDQSVASKTGSLDAVRNDVAIVMGRDAGGIPVPMVLSIFTYENADHGWTVDNEAEVEIAKLARVIVDAWSPLGLDAKALTPGLGLAGAAACRIGSAR
jgi:beta-lactamase class A